MNTPRTLLTAALLLLPFVAALLIARVAPPPMVAQTATPSEATNPATPSEVTRSAAAAPELAAPVSVASASAFMIAVIR